MAQTRQHEIILDLDTPGPPPEVRGNTDILPFGANLMIRATAGRVLEDTDAPAATTFRYTVTQTATLFDTDPPAPGQKGDKSTDVLPDTKEHKD